MTISSIAAIAVLVTVLPAAPQPANDAALRIVIIEGEDAVNIIQQKTAVAPIVEVRDRNNLPVSGATVTFAVGPGGSFAGQSTLTVVTNAAGQATATGLTPSAAGAIQIQATATFQGQTAVATIAQSNVMTAAEVAGTTAGSAGGSGGGSGGASGAAGGGGAGGGISATTIGIIAGAAAGGTLVATQAGGGGNDAPGASTTTSPGSSSATTTPTTTPNTPPTQQPTSASFQGPMDGTFTGTSTVSFPDEPAFNCTFSLRNTGNATLQLQTASGGNITGTLNMNGMQTPDITSCTGANIYPIPPQPFAWSAPVTGSGNTIRFSQEFRDSATIPGSGSYSSTATITFTGTISGGAVSGSLSWNAVTDIRIDGGGTSRATWTGTINLNLR